MRKFRLLIADDDSAFLRLLTIRFQLLGYEVMTATNGHDALVLASDEPPDLLILDINMPGRGFHVHRSKRQLGSLRLVPVIYVTGETSEGAINLARRLGAFSVLKKPLDFWKLVDTVHAALEIHGDYARAERLKQIHSGADRLADLPPAVLGRTNAN